MRVCYFFLLSLVLAVLLSWLVPMVDNFSSIYPNILLIEGIKQQNDPPLYSALIKTLQSFENKPKESKLNEIPLYDESSFAIPILSTNGNICIFLIRTEVSSENLADPYTNELKILERPITDLFTPTSGTWKELWLHKISGKVYLIASSKNLYDMAVVYQVNLDQGTTHRIRYYPDRTIPEYNDFPLPGSSSVMSLSIYQDMLVYAVEEGFYTFHYMRKVFDDDGKMTGWEEFSKGNLQNRKDFSLSEVTGLKLLSVNDTVYMLQSNVNAKPWQGYGKLSLELLEYNSTDWNSLGSLYNLSLNEYLVNTHDSEELKSNSRIRVCNENSVFIGHYGMVLMYIHIT